MKYLTIIFLLCLSFVFSCKKEDEPSNAPAIVFKSISETEVQQFDNSIEIVFDYEDHNGDLGEPDPDEYSLSVKDSRLSEADWFHIPPMTPDLQELHIAGSYTLQIPPLFLLGNGSQETTNLTLQLTDREGNLSNQITTPVILIVDSL